MLELALMTSWSDAVFVVTVTMGLLHGSPDGRGTTPRGTSTVFRTGEQQRVKTGQRFSPPRTMTSVSHLTPAL